MSSGDALPTLSDPDSYTTPAVTVPANNDNPYIVRHSNPSGTVFIAVGAIVGAIFLGFIFYHLIRSLTASRLAKKTLDGDKEMYEKYQNNNSTAYGGHGITASSTYNTESVAKLPLLSHHASRQHLGGFTGASGSQIGDTSTIYASETAAATSKHDLTKMFISPTAEVMSHNRTKSGHFGGSTNSLFGGSTSNLGNPSPATNRHSQLVPSLYINNETNNSDYSLNSHAQSQQGQPQQSQQQQQLNTPGKNNRRAIPSMYLEDLIDNE
ncbi:DEHA2C06468p [Debaryomyces hansenii CBS767]|uniref:DEHA2C06468p n=1 Tax=Debaryomyces hansenii (strain ATCC 36239 / CBS 767 / BCRC 21394 / JCM 1990 / NBRC 0083 / IGC 2968) TaxID=284592 RepID=Q6BV02_DEBHA|nr:DEHA2C06468p [Debaryomyces hansenii CBS767]CAG86025.2 DEHA2C06468p [Debaryomyces hansenii CBS767]|eukprot:XP_457967.2 DEHA2C06468p [Debaryomyces hansenii CBS767]